jgi:hypothetical protein
VIGARRVGLGWWRVGINGSRYYMPEERSGVDRGVQAQCSSTSDGGSALMGCQDTQRWVHGQLRYYTVCQSTHNL